MASLVVDHGWKEAIVGGLRGRGEEVAGGVLVRIDIARRQGRTVVSLVNMLGIEPEQYRERAFCTHERLAANMGEVLAFCRGIILCLVEGANE